MAGLLGEDYEDPATQGLLSAGLSMLAASGPSTKRTSVGQVLGLGGLQGMQAYQQAQKMALLKAEEERRKHEAAAMEEYRRMQIRQMQSLMDKESKQSALESAIQQAAKDSVVGREGMALSGGGGPTNTNASILNQLPVGSQSFDQQGFLNRLMGLDPLKAIALQQELRKRDAPMVTKPGDVLRDPNDPTKIIAQNPAEQKLSDSQKGYQLAKEQGFPGSFIDYQLALRRAGATNVSVNSFEPAAVALQKEMATNLGKQADALQAAPVALQNIANAKELIKSAGGFVGSFAGQKLEVAKFLNNNLGMNIDPNGIASAEELRSRIFFNVMDNLKKMDAQPSQLQQKIMMDALGNLGTDPNALPRVLDAFAESIRGKVEAHNKRAEQAMAKGVPLFFDPRIDLGTPKTSAPGSPPVGYVFRGYRFKGGDPTNQENWEPVR